MMVTGASLEVRKGPNLLSKGLSETRTLSANLGGASHEEPSGLLGSVIVSGSSNLGASLIQSCAVREALR